MTTTATPANATRTEPASGRPAPVPRESRARLRRLGRRTMQALACILALALVGAVFQAIAERVDAAANPAPGTLVELSDGRSLHMQVQGAGNDGPTILLESGAGASSAGWAWVAPALAEHHRVVSYDRAGLGWSDGTAHGADVDAVISDLREALDRLDIGGPYVLVGHSLGGHYVRAFAERHPADTVGVVLVDPSHEEQSRALEMSSGDMAPMLNAYRLATHLGLTRIYDPFTADLHSLPEPARGHALAQQANARTAASMAKEMGDMDAVGAQLGGPGALKDMPVQVLIAAGGATDEATAKAVAAMAELRLGLTQLSTNAVSTTLPEASHVTILTDPAFATTVTETVRAAVAAAAR